MRRTIITFAIALACLVVYLSPSSAAFVSATVIELQLVRDVAGVTTGISFVMVLRDDATPELRRCSYLVTGTEFVTLPGGAAAKKVALLAIAKREAHTCFDKWVAERAAAAQAPVPRDPLTDLGAASFANFTGEAAPLPTP